MRWPTDGPGDRSRDTRESGTYLLLVRHDCEREVGLVWVDGEVVLGELEGRGCR